MRVVHTTKGLSTFEEWRRAHPAFIAGGDGDDDDANADADAGSGSDGDDTDADADADADAGDSEDEDTGDVDAVARLEKQVSQLQNEKKAAEQAAAKAKQEAKKAKEENNQKQGNWKGLAEDRLAERDEANTRAENAEKERDEATSQLDDFTRSVRVTNLAVRMGFKDPADAMDLLRAKEGKLRASGASEEEVDLTGTDASAERALRKLADEKKYLVDPARATGRPMSGGGRAGSGSGLTRDAIANMSPDEVAKRMPEIQEFQRNQLGANSG